jgi:hypothetical protein
MFGLYAIDSASEQCQADHHEEEVEADEVVVVMLKLRPPLLHVPRKLLHHYEYELIQQHACYSD